MSKGCHRWALAMCVCAHMSFVGVFSESVARIARAAESGLEIALKSKNRDTPSAIIQETEKRDRRIILIVPFDDEHGMPVGAMMADTNHDCGDFFAASMKGKPHKYGTIVQPIYAVWASGKVRWQEDDGRYYDGHVPAHMVRRVLSSIETRSYNTPDNVQCSYSATRPDNREYEDYWVLFVSKGVKENILFCSHLHAYREAHQYLKWGWKDVKTRPDPLYYRSEKRTWPEFGEAVHEEIPAKLVRYLNAWDSLRSKLLSLTPEKSSATRIDIHKTKQVCYSYRFDDKASQWVREAPQSVGSNRGTHY